jgi:hypothetical protein
MKLRTDVEVLKKDVDQFNKLFSRMDDTMEKLGQVSSDLVRMLAVHDNKFSQIEQDHQQVRSLTEVLFEKNEERRDENEKSRDQFRTEIAKLQTVVLSEIKEHHKTSEAGKVLQNARITALEKWKWMLVGSAVVLGFILNTVLKNYISL